MAHRLRFFVLAAWSACHALTRTVWTTTLLAASLALALAASPARAQSEASLVLSALPVASVVGVAGSAVAGAVAVSALLHNERITD